MTEIEKMKRYIERTKMGLSLNSPYQINMREAFAVADMEPLEAVIMAFNYGKAKGYRAAKAEVRR